MTSRRSRVCGTLGVVILLVVAGVAPAVATTDADVSESWTTLPNHGGEATSTPSEEAVLHQRGIVSRNDEPGSVTLTFEYEVPSSVTGLRVAIPVVSLDGITVDGMEGFERTEDGRFLWDTETERPTVSIRMAVGDSMASGVRGLERDDWAFVSEPNTRVQVRTDARPLQTDSLTIAEGEDGFARSHLAYVGAHERRNVTVGDGQATFVLGAADANPGRAIEFLRTADGRFDFGVQRDSMTVFVLPLSGLDEAPVQAATVDTAFWVGRSGVRLDSTGSVFTHEYVHTRLGTVGRSDATWLTEASAEYYGRVFAFNDGIGTYDSFLDGLRADEYGPDGRSAVLTDSETWRGTSANYDKGAHVLAALDAEIQRRTDGEQSLSDVFAGRSEPFQNYQAFRAAVIEVTGDDSIGSWLDRYATTDDLPPLPTDPAYYVADPSLDPDGDGMASGAELDADRHPFVEGEARDRLSEEQSTASDSEATTDAEMTGEQSPETSGVAPGFGAVTLLAALAALAIALGRRSGPDAP
ncbi:hypothetical protein [Haloplanus sp. C73]|uniref:hypothetical protein n=1 Tax=Haloplanus sp. C73 TaxID=3421641 RepID=UPI003EBB3FF4